MRPSFQTCLVVLLSALGIAAQPASHPTGVRGPVVGLALDANAQVRPLLGVPGAASLGSALALDASFQLAAISPHQDYLLGFQSGSGNLAMVADPLGAAHVSVIAGISGPASFTLSPTGTAALAIAAGASTAQVLTGLPDSPALAWQADLSALPAPASAFAISDDGSALLAAANNGAATSLFRDNRRDRPARRGQRRTTRGPELCAAHDRRSIRR